MKQNGAQTTHVLGFVPWKLATFLPCVAQGPESKRQKDLSTATGHIEVCWRVEDGIGSRIYVWWEDRTWLPKGVMDMVIAQTGSDRVSSRSWHSVAMACCQHTIQQRTPERIQLPMRRTAASWRQLPSWQRTASEEKGKRESGDPPWICERGWDGNTNRGEYPSMCQVGINVRISWQVLRSLSPPTPAHTQTHCCPAWNTWYISSGIWPRWLLPAALHLRQLGVLALPLHQLPVAPPG